jgi:hypothetical protein
LIELIDLIAFEKDTQKNKKPYNVFPERTFNKNEYLITVDIKKYIEEKRKKFW